jgi:hypothetical protein
LRHDTTRDILIYLIELAGSTESNIANFKNFPPPTISWHMSRLIEAAIVIGRRKWKTNSVFIKDPENLIDGLKNPTIRSSLSDRFAKLFIQISTERRRGST